MHIYAAEIRARKKQILVEKQQHNDLTCTRQTWEHTRDDDKGRTGEILEFW
jgi:hypothetical protein